MLLPSLELEMEEAEQVTLPGLSSKPSVRSELLGSVAGEVPWVPTQMGSPRQK